MTTEEYQTKADSIVGYMLCLLESYELPHAAIKSIRKSLFEQIDKYFMEAINDRR
jgi:hypothetical protein